MSMLIQDVWIYEIIALHVCQGNFLLTLVQCISGQDLVSTCTMNTVNGEILAGIKFGGFGYTSSQKNIGGFKFGGHSLAPYAHTK